MSGLLFKDDHFESKAEIRDGDPRSRRAYVACERCNTGWMSRLQEAAKPHLLPLIKGERAFIKPYDQRLIAAWAATCVMCAEWYNPELVSIPFSDREYLRLYLEAPKSWKIWIGRYLRGKWKGYWVHHSVPILENVPEPDDATPWSPNTQTTTFVVGQLFIHAFSSVSPGLTDKWRFTGFQGITPAFLVQISPSEEGFIAWPTKDIPDAIADQIAGYIFTELHQIGRLFGY
jgi:hypothetical protein